MRMLTLVATSDRELHRQIQENLGNEFETVLIANFDDLLLALPTMSMSARFVFLDWAILPQDIESFEKARLLGPVPEWIVLSQVSLSFQTSRQLLEWGVFSLLPLPLDAEQLSKTIVQADLYTDSLQKLNQTLINPFLNSNQSQYMVIKTLAKTRQLAGAEPFSEDELLALFPINERKLESTLRLFEELYGVDGAAKAKSYKKIKVLAVDDEEGIRMAIEDLLQLFRFQPIMAANAAEALELSKKHDDIDVFLLDIGLPDISGIELLPKLKAYCPDAEAIMLTAYQDTTRMVSSFQNAAYTYLTKPFDNPVLFEALSKAIQRRYLHKTVDRFGKPAWGLLSEGTRLKLLRNLAEKRQLNNQGLCYKDVFMFFPELRESGVDEATQIPKKKIEDGLMYVVEELRVKSIKS